MLLTIIPTTTNNNSKTFSQAINPTATKGASASNDEPSGQKSGDAVSPSDPRG